MATPTGTGRQRFDFTDATVIGNVASGPASGGGSDELLVRLVDDQFQDLMKAIQAGPPKSPVMTVNIASSQFSALMAAIANLKSPTPTVPTPTAPIPKFIIPSDPLADLRKSMAASGKELSALANSIDGVVEKLVERVRGGKEQANVKPGFSPTFNNAATSKFTGGDAASLAVNATKNTAVEGLSSVAGRFIPTLAAVDVAASGVASVFRTATSAVQTFGEAARKVASNDGIGFMTTGLNAASDALGKIPVVGKVFSAGLDLASAGLTTFKSVLDAFTARGRELAKYNPQIAFAAAQADVRRIFADIREANQNAARYADLILKSQQLEESFQRALQPLKEAIMNLLIKLTPVAQGVADGIGKTLNFLTGGSSNVNSLDQLLWFVANASNEQIQRVVDRLKDNTAVVEGIYDAIRARQMGDGDPRKMLDDMLDTAMNLPLEPPAAARSRDKDGMKFPLS